MREDGRELSQVQTIVQQIDKAHSSFGVTPKVVTTNYDRAESIFPESVSNALGHNTTTVVHPAFGAPLWTRDLNGNITRTWYDSFFRPIQTELLNVNYKHPRTSITSPHLPLE